MSTVDITESDILDDIHKCIQSGEPHELNIESVNLIPLERRKIFGAQQAVRAIKRCEALSGKRLRRPVNTFAALRPEEVSILPSRYSAFGNT